jgi:hypothetical protein
VAAGHGRRNGSWGSWTSTRVRPASRRRGATGRTGGQAVLAPPETKEMVIRTIPIYKS